MILDKINNVSDLKSLSKKELVLLAEEIRNCIISRSQKVGGHLGSNLAIVELTIALHYVFSSPKDKIIFDTSHQCYTHKILTGRKLAFISEERFHDVDGFSNPAESPHDIFKTGHTSTSISLAVGLAKARDVKSQTHNVIAVIGDGALSGGEALEGLNLSGELKSNLIIITNDNDMSIAENHGGLYMSLKALRESKGKSQNNIFRAFGLDYYYEENGNNINSLISVLSMAKNCKRPTVIHINTEKGHGFAPAIENKEIFHHVKPSLNSAELFDPTVAFSNHIIEMCKTDKELYVLSSGTALSVGFDETKRSLIAEQFIDTGICEQSAMSMASGMAKGKIKPVLAICSSFLQRAYDQLSEDVSLNKSPVSLVIFGASILQSKPATHLGIFDIPLLKHIPNLVYLAPTTRAEFLSMVDYTIKETRFPVAVRAPYVDNQSPKATLLKSYDKPKYQIVQRGSKVAIIGLGSFFSMAVDACNLITKKYGIVPTIINPRFISPLDRQTLEALKDNHELIVTLEDGVLCGGFGESISAFFANSNVKVLNFGLKSEFYDNYDPKSVLKSNGLEPYNIVNVIIKTLKSL